VTPDIAALLEVQTDDLSIHELERGIEQLMPKVNALNAECVKAKAAVDQASQLAEAEEKRRNDVHHRIDTHKQLLDKNQAVLNAVTTQKEATAATAQLEQVTKIIAEEERELGAIGQRLAEIRVLVDERGSRLAELEAEREIARESIAADRTRLEGELNSIRVRRNQKASGVTRPLMSTYDRIRSKKRIHAIFAIIGTSCSNCDTAVPLQRRTQMFSTGRTEVCEGCGVLLFAGE
jgi:predicted  nucleic acid-binding Zn-ribbon protein